MPASIRRLNLHNFRNYHAASLEADAPTIVLVGPNGAGKTNLIEAISFLAPGRGLRPRAGNPMSRAKTLLDASGPKSTGPRY